MGWFESQIEERERADAARLEASLRALSDAVTGKRSARGTDGIELAKDALTAVLRYYGASPAKTPSKVKSVEELIEYQLQCTGIMHRPVRLSGKWTEDAIGAMLGFLQDGTPVALLPQKRGGYAYRSPEDGTLKHLGASSLPQLRQEAYCFYRPLPQRKLGIRELLMFMAQSLESSDYAAVALSTLAAVLLGMALPAANSIVFGPAVEAGQMRILGPVAALLTGALFAQVLIGGIKQLVLTRIATRIDVPLQAAIMMRVLSLPASFFRNYQTGDLAMRIDVTREVAAILQNVLLSTLLTSVFSLIYIAQIWTIAPPLALPAFGIIAVSATITAVVTLIQARVTRQQLALSAKRSGWEYALITGIQKIKLAGAEARAFSTWADIYQQEARLLYNGPLITRLSGPLQTAVSLAGTMLLYGVAVASGVTVAKYMAFAAAYGMVSGAFSEISNAAAQIASIKPLLELAEPILGTVPESSETKPALRRLSGGIQMDNVTFSYGQDQPPVLDGVSLKIRPGDYIAVVGRTGCGKSTLMRLLLGFEKPQRGAIYYDGRDLSSIDAASVRRNIGVVLQDSMLFTGSIYDNIAISAPGLSLEEAWEAARLAGIADDIEAMPMGMRTLVTEAGGGISGGQRQRLMIARAIASRPRILMFDEATSALDNATQRIVSDSLDSLKCTRLIIAHRLSTIRNCDRILVLDSGTIVEEGTYDELMTKGGLFVELVSRQQV